MKQEHLHLESYKAAVRFIDAQRRLLSDASADANLLEGMSAIIRHLYKLPNHQVDRLFGVKESSNSKDARELAIKVAAELTLEDIERKIESEDLLRSDLEAIAIGRFHVPKGSMRSMGNLDRLKDKLRTFIQNERTHVTITELAKNSR